MDAFLDRLPTIIAGQALGVALALGVDALSWKWRRDENAVFGLNFLNLVFVLPFVLFCIAGNPWILWILAALILWLLCLAIVQSRQLKTTLRAAFFGALMQLGCFGWTLFVALFLLLLPALFTRGFDFFWFYAIYLLSALLTYALLSLFRPTINGIWNALQSRRKSRPRP